MFYIIPIGIILCKLFYIIQKKLTGKNFLHYPNKYYRV
jgi:hypothetical protein